MDDHGPDILRLWDAVSGQPHLLGRGCLHIFLLEQKAVFPTTDIGMWIRKS